MDKDLDSGASEDFALAAPLHVPFVCGGLITMILPLAILENVPIGLVVCVLWAVLVGLYLFGRRLAKTA